MKKNTFPNFPEDSICPVCGTSENKECVLIPIDKTQKDGLCQAQPVHVDCVRIENFSYNKEVRVIYVPANH